MPSNGPTDTSFFEFNDGQRIAVIVTGIIGTISTLTVSLLLLHLFTVSFVSGRASANKDERIFLRMHLGAFVVCLLFSDLIQGLSGIIQLVWASNKQITSGPLCTAQAAMLLFGDNGTAFWNAIVAIHTFWTVVLGKRMSTVVVAFLIATGWTTCVILTVIGPLAIQTDDMGPFYAIAGAWCFVTGNYKNSRIYLHYVPMLLSAFIITVLYLLVALVLFGILIVDGSKWRFKAPSGDRLRDYFGQFSWGRLHRPSGPTHTHSTSMSSGGIKSVRRPPGSIRLGSLPPRNSDVKGRLEVPEEPSVTTIQSVDIAQRPDTGSTGVSDGSLDRGRKNTSKTIGNQEVKKPLTAHGQTQVSMSNQVSGRALQLKTLAIKMLWYPIVYLILILPIAISRVDSSVNVSLSVMLGFMCLLWLMGTANTVIYVCTRRLGPTPWSRRTLSLSRSRSKSGRVEGTAVSHSVVPVQIQVDRFTQRATDEQFMEIAREKSVASSSYTGADIPVISSMPSVAHRDSRDNISRDYRESKVGFDFTGGGGSRHVLRQGSLSSPISSPNTVTTFSLTPRPLPPRPSQERHSSYIYTMPRQPAPSEQHDQPQERIYHEPHPYSHARSPTHNSAPLPTSNAQPPTFNGRRSHEAPTAFYPHYYEDDDESLRTQSPTHSRKGSANSRGGVGIGY